MPPCQICERRYSICSQRRGEALGHTPAGGSSSACGWGSGRTLLVAVRRDAAGRDLLTWALAKAAVAGDRVVALHVSTADVSGTEEMSRAAADSLASVLAAYDGFCNLNQINLEFMVFHGSSVKKALLKEAISYGAAQLILGVMKNSPLGLCATAVAKYCAKRVPGSCTVLAVNNGAIVYHGNANQCCTIMFCPCTFF